MFLRNAPGMRYVHLLILGTSMILLGSCADSVDSRKLVQVDCNDNYKRNDAGSPQRYITYFYDDGSSLSLFGVGVCGSSMYAQPGESITSTPPPTATPTTTTAPPSTSTP